MVIQAEPAGSYREPGGESGPPIGIEGSKTPEVSLSEFFQDIAVPFHGGVMTAAQGSGNREKKPGMIGDEALPRRFPQPCIRGMQELTQFEGNGAMHRQGKP